MRCYQARLARLARGLFLIRLTSLIVAILAMGAPAYAQQITPDLQRDAEREQRRELERTQQREEEFRETQRRAPRGADLVLEEAPDDAEEQCIPIRHAVIEGVRRYPEAEFAQTVAELVGVCTPVSSIDDVLRTITNRYISDGFVTSRAVVVANELASGLLRILVVEGVVDQLSSVGRENARPYGQGELAFALPGLRKRHLNLRDLEQGVDQLGRLRSSEANIDILPSETPGASDVVITRRRLGPSLRPSIAFDNDGSSRTGTLQSTVNLDVDNPLGIADVWSFYYFTTLDGGRDRGSRGFGGFVSIPYGYTTFNLSVGRSTYDSVLESNSLLFASQGKSTNGSASIDQLVYRDGKTKLSLSANLALLDTENKIQQIRLSTNSYRLITSGINARLQRRIGSWLLFADFGYTQGLDILGANAIDLGPGSPEVVFSKLNSSINLQNNLRAFGIPFSYSGSFSGAAALDPVLPAERFNLGGKYTVRGFREDGISGQYGAFMRHQLGFGLGTLFKDARYDLETQVALLAGYDIGGILARSGDPFERGLLQSSSLGIQFVSRRIQADLSVSAPLSSPSTVFHEDYEFSAEIRISI